MDVNNLLQQILRDPNSPALSQIAEYIRTDPGKFDFLESLKQNNSLAYIYLKMNIKDWISRGVNQMYYSPEFISYLISVANKNNKYFICEYIEYVSRYSPIGPELVSQLVNQRSFEILDAIFKKYVDSPRSNELFIEIGRNIEIMIPLLQEVYMKPKVVNLVEAGFQQKMSSIDKSINIESTQDILSPVNIPEFKPVTVRIDSPDFYNEHLLSIFYSLVSQDIHGFFEDNSEYFFKIFLILFDDLKSREMIIKIFDLFITKYPEFTNFESIILSLTRTEYLDPIIMNTLTKAYEYKRLHSNIIIQMLRRVLVLSYDEEDVYSFTKDMLRGVDIYRGCVYKLLRLLSPNIYYFYGESAIFVASVTKFQDSNLINICTQIISSPMNDFTLSFSAFMYLVNINNFTKCSLSYLSTDLKYLCIKYISYCFKSEDVYHTRKLLEDLSGYSVKHGRALESVPNSPYIGANNSSFDLSFLSNIDMRMTTSSKYDLQELIGYLQHHLIQRVDEFASELLFRICKNNENLYSFELHTFLSKILEGIEKISTASAGYLIDLYISVCLKLKKHNLALVEVILNKELIEFYSFAFMYLSVLILEMEIGSEYIINIVKHDVLWSEKSLHMGLCLIMIAAYRKGIVDAKHISGVYSRVDNTCKLILLAKCGLRNPNLSDPEGMYLVNNDFDASWMRNNYFDRKLARMLMKKLVNSKDIDRGYVSDIVGRNIRNIEFEYILHSVTVYFDL